MRPLFEKVTVPEGASWSLLDRRLDDAIPFQWHYHPEFELTLTLNSRGQRYVGDHIGSYDNGDLVLLGPNLPHTWCSRDRLDARRPHHALVMWFTREWAAGLTAVLTELRPLEALLQKAERGVMFSQAAAKTVRPTIEWIPSLDPASRLVRLVEVLATLAHDKGAELLAGPSYDRRPGGSADHERIDRVLAHIHDHYREAIPVARLAGIACLSLSGLHRLFRRHTRMTVTDYISQLRIGQACALLINTRRPIATIADEVGYANLANFNRQFRALKGMTPRELRRTYVAASQNPKPDVRLAFSHTRL